ncbi:MAG: penicillin-insensitive murein endopeptidase [Solirubrobacterales bacterium]
MSRTLLTAALAVIGLAPGALALALALDSDRSAGQAPPTVAPPAPAPVAPPAPGAVAGLEQVETDEIRWRRSSVIGKPFGGRLLHGVQLPTEGPEFFTWDPILKRVPNRPWRRWAADGTLRVLLGVIREFRAATPDAPRVAIGDLSRPGGGDFGPRFGKPGHSSHQNGLDIDLYYPRRDRLERAAARVGQVDQRLSQDLVDRFVAAGAKYVFVGPRTRLGGPRKVVSKLVHHDDHMHIRLRARGPVRD